MIELRPLRRHKGCASVVAGWLNDKAHTRYSERRHHRHSAESVIKEWTTKGPTLFWGIARNGTFVGTISATIDAHNKTADLGIMICRPSWKKGIATKAWAGLSTKLFNEGIEKIEAGCMANNQHMIQVFERAGMKYEGRRIKHFQFTKNKRVDAVYYGKFK